MELSIARADLSEEALQAFLTDHLADLAPTAPAESRHALDLDGLRAPGVRLWAARDGDVLVATGALAAVEPARGLYAAAGFVECGPFGGYREDPNSVFMSVSLR